MKYLGTLFLLLCVGSWASAQVLTTENFNYTIGDSLTSHGWLAHSGTGTNVETVTTGLTYAGYIGSGIGGASTLAVTGQDVNKTWASAPNGITSGSIYYSLLVNLDSAQTAGDYFFHFFKNSSTFPARLFVKKAFNSQNFSFGILKGSTAANIAWSDSIYSFGTTYLVVAKYAFVAGATNDSVALWINPDISGTEPAPTVLETSADKATADYDTVYGVAIRQGTGTNAPRGKVDGIRVGQSWRSVNNKLNVLSTSSINYGLVTVNSTATDSVVVKNDDATTTNITSVTSGNPLFVVTPTSATLAPGGSKTFVIRYTPTAASPTSSAIVIVSDASSSPDSVHVSGTGVLPGFTISTKSFSFGNVYTDSTVVDSFTVTNSLASGNLVIDSVKSSNSVFTVGPTNANLGTAASEKFGVTFTPTVAGVASSFVVFYNNGGLVADTLRVSGNGIIKAPLFSATPSLLDFHGVLLGKSKMDSVTIKNTGYDSLFISSIGGADPEFMITPTTARLDSQASKKFYITFTPTSVGLKSSYFLVTTNIVGPLDTLKVVGSGTSFVTIAEASKETNDSIPDYSISGDTLSIAGVITSTNLQSVGSQTAIFIQDSTAGVEIFAYGLPPVSMVVGDSVFVIGTVDQYHGATEFEPINPDAPDTLHFGIVKHHATVPKPRHLTLTQYLANPESFEGLLVEIDTLYKKSGTWPGVLSSGSIYVTDKNRVDSAQMYISSSTDIAGWTEPTYPINVTAVINQYSSSTALYKNGYEIEPSDTSNIVHLVVEGVSNDLGGIPLQFNLAQNYPNPFNPSTTIRFALPKDANVTLKVYDLLGREVRSLVSENIHAGNHEIVWDGHNNSGTQVSSGMYIYRITAGSFTSTKKMLMLK